MNIETGININGVRLSTFRFADDIILFAESEEKLKDKLEDLKSEGQRDGIQPNKKKTKIMCNEVTRKRLRTVKSDDKRRAVRRVDWTHVYRRTGNIR